MLRYLLRNLLNTLKAPLSRTFSAKLSGLLEDPAVKNCTNNSLYGEKDQKILIDIRKLMNSTLELDTAAGAGGSGSHSQSQKLSPKEGALGLGAEMDVDEDLF